MIVEMVLEGTCGYDEVKRVLMNSSGYSAVAATENYFSAVDSSKTFVPGQRLEPVCGWTKKLLEGALNVEEAANRMGRARV